MYVDVLSNCALCKDVPRPRLESLLAEVDADVTFYARGDVVYSPENYQRSLGIVLSGSALVYKLCSDDKRLLMSRLSPGGLFGMAALFGGVRAYPTEIHAEKALTVLFLTEDWLEKAFRKEPLLSRNYIALLSERIRFLTLRIEAIAGDDVRARLLRVLASLHLEQGKRGAIVLPYTLAQLAQLLAIGRASLYRALDMLEEEGILQRKGKQITVLQPRVLPPVLV